MHGIKSFSADFYFISLLFRTYFFGFWFGAFWDNKKLCWL